MIGWSWEGKCGYFLSQIVLLSPITAYYLPKFG